MWVTWPPIGWIPTVSDGYLTLVTQELSLTFCFHISIIRANDSTSLSIPIVQGVTSNITIMFEYAQQEDQSPKPGLEHEKDRMTSEGYKCPKCYRTRDCLAEMQHSYCF